MRLRIALTAALTAATLSACGSTDTAATPPPAPTTTTRDTAELLAWVDKVCGVTVTSIAPLQQQPTLDWNNLPKMKTQFLDYLTKSSQSLATGVTALGPLKTGPTKDAERYVDTHTQTLTKMKDSLDKATKDVQGANPKDSLNFGLTLQSVGNEIQLAAIGAGSPIGILVEKDLADAEKQAPNCKKLQSS
ncbi:hypothetical protein [Actinocrispum wychmicini]|uniref:Uncharacterized protein n=1 Tax=Actinocrispum wychmicini TaxID=1213861 RepID=A0A4R2J6Q3_9PSEU|nr:hypothetical protein [Actinocrispum wychmicini]TCO53767.1 hypothetical protein EV192_110359 [Actinocrispum wychmicini]